MPKTLVIAEKPSVAADLARVLGKFTKEKDFFENDQYIISSAIGHLVEISAPADEEVKRGKWKLENLPIIPTHFELHPIEKTADRFNLLKRLLKHKDVESVINACDAGREGELIFRYIIQLAGVKKPIRRLWLQSMTPQAIRDNFQKLRTDEQMQPLADAAMCRSEADWLIGINGTRALTSFNSQGGGFQKTTVGRVQTPTLCILVDREAKIRRFQSKPFWEIHATFEAQQGSYNGRYFDEKFKKPDEAKDSDQKPERIWDIRQAEEIAKVCRGKQGVVEEESKPATQLSPLLFDLTSLQREANGRFGFPAKMTLSIAQSLYEKHKALTYPRTDSRYLPEDYASNVRAVLGELKSTFLRQHAEQILSAGWVKPNKRIFNQARVSDHFAIIPTSQLPSKLTEPEQKIYDMVTKRFLAVFYPAAVFEVTTRITRVESHAFKSEGRILKEPGWMAVYGKGEQGEEDQQAALVAVEKAEKVKTEAIEVRALQTKPPPRYTEATLLSAMEGAGKLVEDEELREAMAEKGLGTPATRAAIIEALIFEHYVRREGRELVPTPKAFQLMDTLKAMKIPSLSSPELTGEWEHKLKLMEQRQFSRSQFISEIQQMTRSLVEHVRGFDQQGEASQPTNLVDPFSGQKIVETLRDYRTLDGSLIIRKAIAGRIMDLPEVAELLEKRLIGPLEGFMSKLGRPFSAKVKLTDSKQVELDWETNSEGRAEGEEVDVDTLERIGACPKDQGRILAYRNSFVCEHAMDKAKATCDFRVSGKILGQEISSENMRRLLETGKTDLLTGFISQRTKRPFKAFLVLQEKGKIGFEFPPREAKAKSKQSKKS